MFRQAYGCSKNHKSRILWSLFCQQRQRPRQFTPTQGRVNGKE